jgi:YD repeat-containing protein
MRFKLRLSIFIQILITILMFPLIARAQIPIDCGQTLSTSISGAGERDTYTFTASANDGITIRARKTSGNFTPYLELYGPNGNLITSAANKINRILKGTGTYTVVVRDQNNTNTGDYVLFWQRVNNPCGAMATTCGQVVTGSIGTAVDPPPWRVFTFTAAANDAVSIRSVRTSGGSFTPLVELYNPTGSFVTGKYNNSLDRVLTTAGTYTILISDYNNSYAGDFLLVWQRVNNSCIASPVSCGQVLSNSIGGLGEMDVYTFTASTNDGVTIRTRKTTGTFSVFMELYGPTGTRITTSSSGKIDRVLTMAGIYKVIVRDSSYVNTGDYLLYWERISNPCNAFPIDCGQGVTGSIGTAVNPPPWRGYSFNVLANDSVTIRVTKTSGTFTPYFELYGPAGNLVGSSASRMDKTLTTVGTYTIILRDQNNLNGGGYVLTWLKVNNPCNGIPIGCGQILEGGMSVEGKIDAYILTAKGGDNIVLTLTKTSGGFDPFLELYTNSGTRIANKYTSSGTKVTITQTLSVEGMYTILVSDYGNNETGSYALSFQKNNNFCAEVNVTVPKGGEKIMVGSHFMIQWSCTSCQGIHSQEIRLSTDGGMSFPNVIATGLSGSARSFAWNVPIDIITNNGRIRVTVADASGMNTSDESDANFEIYQGVSRTYVYDELNRLIQVISEDGRKVTYVYDALGNRITVTNE